MFHSIWIPLTAEARNQEAGRRADVIWIVRKNCSATWLIARSYLSCRRALCEGAKTDLQIATATGLSQSDISFSLDRLLDCGCVQGQDTGHLVLYGLSDPRLLQLEGIVDEMLIAALQGRRSR
jgi:Bacterial regulatory protein, arsR family